MVDSDASNKAAQFNSASLRYLSRASETNLQVGNVDATFVAWIYGDTFVGASPILAKRGAAMEYQMHVNSDGTLRGHTGPTLGTVTTTATVTTGTWNMAMWRYTASGTLLEVSWNAGTPVSGSVTLPGVSTEIFNIGYDGNTSYFDGRVDSVGFWKKVLTAAEVTKLYRSGSGLRYCQIAAGDSLLTSLTGWWNLGEASGNRLDDTANALTLTSNATVGQAAGVTSGACDLTTSAGRSTFKPSSTGGLGSGSAGGAHGF